MPLHIALGVGFDVRFGAGYKVKLINWELVQPCGVVIVIWYATVTFVFVVFIKVSEIAPFPEAAAFEIPGWTARVQEEVLPTVAVVGM